MIPRNLIRIEDQDVPVYRIFSKYRFFELIETKELVLVRPSRWDDPFENFILKCVVEDQDGTKIGLSEIEKRWYGQCWSFRSESDAMWRIYSPNKDGIRVKTTIKKLATILWEDESSLSPLSYFIGKVQYLPREDIEKFIQNTSFESLTVGGQNDRFAETLLTKRTEFDHEYELRILAFNAENNPRAQGETFIIPINPNELIDEVCIDPRISDNEVEKIKEDVLSKGFVNTIIQSDMYKVQLKSIKIK